MSELSKKEEDFSRYLYTCPVCDRPFTVVLQHLNTYKECKEKVTETQREELVFFLTLPLTSGKGTLSSLSILTDVNLVWRFSVCEGAWWRGECESECECVE